MRPDCSVEEECQLLCSLRSVSSETVRPEQERICCDGRGNVRLTAPLLVILPDWSTWTSGPSQVQSKYDLIPMLADDAWKFLKKICLFVEEDERNEAVVRKFVVGWWGRSPLIAILSVIVVCS